MSASDQAVLVTGIGIVSALGNLTETWGRTLKGQTAIALHQPFPTLESFPLALIQDSPVDLNQLRYRAVAEALQDAQLEPPLSDCGVVMGSSRSYQGQIEYIAQQRSLSSLSRWLNVLPHQCAIAAAHQIGATGVVQAPMAACATGLWAVAQGYELIKTGQCDRVLAGAVEAPITPLSLAGFRKMGALAATGCYPFDRQREGLVLGEAAAVLVLESARSAVQHDAKVYGQILGVGLTADGHHVSAPNPDQQAAIAAIEHCLKRSHLSTPEVDYIHAHGTSTRLNDQNEATLIQQLFPHAPLVSSTKGATGHSLGASGALGLSFCLLALRHQTAPPCVGLKQPDFSLNFVRQAHSAPIKTALCFSFGFGGQNAVVAVGQPFGS
ncbi:MAG: beta-ketoacyl-ACP synthase [Thainema sp.]